MTPSDLADWKEITPAAHTKCDGAWQRCIRDDRVKRYFVQLEMWDHRRYGVGRVGWQADAQFNRGALTFNLVLLNCADKTPDEVLALFEDAFTSLGCDNYDDGDE